MHSFSSLQSACDVRVGGGRSDTHICHIVRMKDLIRDIGKYTPVVSTVVTEEYLEVLLGG